MGREGKEFRGGIRKLRFLGVHVTSLYEGPNGKNFCKKYKMENFQFIGGGGNA